MTHTHTQNGRRRRDIVKSDDQSVTCTTFGERVIGERCLSSKHRRGHVCTMVGRPMVGEATVTSSTHNEHTRVTRPGRPSPPRRRAVRVTATIVGAALLYEPPNTSRTRAFSPPPMIVALSALTAAAAAANHCAARLCVREFLLYS